jgi:spore coat polysaccharide biosynthesis predicted glycosyltransferase SpsG
VVPIIIVELAENQKYIAKTLDKNNIAINLGWYSKVTYKKIQNAIKMIIGSEAKRNMMGVCGRDLINGQGKYKVLNEIYN